MYRNKKRYQTYRRGLPCFGNGFVLYYGRVEKSSTIVVSNNSGQLVSICVPLASHHELD